MLTIADSTFSGNSAFESGGGIWNDRTLSIIKTTFSGNGARYSGGGIYSSGKVTVAQSTFSDNSANVGSGIWNSGTLNVTSSAFSGNDSAGGGVIENDSGGTLTVTNCTFSDNSLAGVFAGDIYNLGSSSLKSTILAGSRQVSVGPADNCSGTIADGGYNISDDASCAFSATGSRNSTNPLLDPAGLQNNGGPTETIALVSGSPAIDAIPLGDCTDQESHPINTDQRGALRPDAGEVSCDIGAYEFQDLAGQEDCDGKTISALVRHFGGLDAAAAALGFPTKGALLIAIRISCGG
jgi:predicted outer membrane repeat protein